MLDSFLQNLRDEGRATWTVEKYHYAARRFLLWADRRGGVAAVTADDLQTYLRRYRTPASRRFHLAVIRSLLHHLRERQIVPHDIAQALRPPPVPERPPRILTDDEQRVILAAAKAHGVEAELLVNLLRYSGLRVGEVVGYRRTVWDPETGRRVREEIPGLRLGDVDLDRRVVMVEGKGGRSAPAYLDDPTVALIRRQLGELSYRDPGAPIFQDRTGRPRGTRWSGRLFRRLVRVAKPPRRITPHMLRHTFLTRFLESGGNLRAAQRLARHRRLSSTLIYADYVHDEALRKEFEEHNRR